MGRTAGGRSGKVERAGNVLPVSLKKGLVMRMIFRLCVILLGAVLVPGAFCLALLIYCAPAAPSGADRFTDEELAAAMARYHRAIQEDANSTNQSDQPPACE